MDNRKLFISTNINILAANEYINDLLVKGSLQTAYEAEPIENNTPRCIYQQFINNKENFVVLYPSLGFNDFLFMHNLDIASPDINVIVTLVRYGSGCRIYMDRAVLRWLLQGSPKEKNLQRNLKNLENFVIDHLEKNNKPVYRFKRIDLALRENFILNQAFHNYTHHNFPHGSHEGIIIDVNFLFTDLAFRANSVYSRNLITNILKIFEAQTLYGEYLYALSRYNAVKRTLELQVEREQEQIKQFNFDIPVYNTQIESYAYKNSSAVDKLIYDTLNGDFDYFGFNAAAPSSDEGLGSDKSNNNDDDAHSTSSAKSHSSCSSSSSSSNNSSRASSRSRRPTVTNNNSSSSESEAEESEAEDNEDVVEDDSDFKIDDKILMPTVRFFRVHNVQRVNEKVTKAAQKILEQSCNLAKTKERFCIVMLHSDKDNVYKFITRQVNTAKLVLPQQKDRIVCGWSGLTTNLKKNQLLVDLKKAHPKRYTVKNVQLHKVKDEDLLIDNLTSLIQSIESDGLATSVSSFVPVVSMVVDEEPYINNNSNSNSNSNHNNNENSNHSINAAEVIQSILSPVSPVNQPFVDTSAVAAVSTEQQQQQQQQPYIDNNAALVSVANFIEETENIKFFNEQIAANSQDMNIDTPHFQQELNDVDLFD